MITIFSTPKPFRGHIKVIQRNAIMSWSLLHPEVEIILFGDEEGAADVCAEFGVRHEPVVSRNSSGLPYLNHIFDTVQNIARHAVVCYANCDIVLMSDFCAALSRTRLKHPRFLMVGQRWEVPITEPYNFSGPAWPVTLRKFVSERGRLAGPFGIDYFAFPRGLYRDMPPLLVGRASWDHWMLWKAKNLGAAVVDATSVVMAIHQIHDYSHHPQGLRGTLEGAEAIENRRLAGGRWHLCTLLEATHRLTPEGESRNWGHSLSLARRYVWRPIWFRFLDASRPLRQRLGLRQGALEAFLHRVRGSVGIQ